MGHSSQDSRPRAAGRSAPSSPAGAQSPAVPAGSARTRHPVREVEVFRGFLRRRGLRVTEERLAVCREIFEQHGHIDAEAVVAALGRGGGAPVSRATVYRNLELLVESGLVRRHRLGRRQQLYEHVHAGQSHDHLVCERCGKVIEFVSPGIRALQGEICRAHGFVPSGHGLEIHGECRLCAAHRAAGAAAAPRPAVPHA